MTFEQVTERIDTAILEYETAVDQLVVKCRRGEISHEQFMLTLEPLKQDLAATTERLTCRFPVVLPRLPR
jgi:hypothetical protein